MFPLFLFRDPCQSAKISGTFCSPSRRAPLRIFARFAQCCQFEALLTRAAEYCGVTMAPLALPVESAGCFEGIASLTFLPLSD